MTDLNLNTNSCIVKNGDWASDIYTNVCTGTVTRVPNTPAELTVQYAVFGVFVVIACIVAIGFIGSLFRALGPRRRY